jgi:peptide/nickel transport system permease protein
VIAAREALLGRLRWQLRFARATSAKIGLAIGACVLVVALAGPFFAPYSPSEIVGRPLTKPPAGGVLGTDFLGRDVLSRVLWGGRSVLTLSIAATLLAYMAGVTIGLVAGYLRSAVDSILMRLMEVVLSFPPLIFLLILATGTSRDRAVLLLGVAVVLTPGAARIVRAATMVASQRAYVEAAVARGERTWSILRRELFPTVLNTVLADAGVRLTSAILLIASVSFLGLGLQPPAADWALMISENRGAITLQPAAVVVPAVLIALLTVSTNLIADAFARSQGVGLER